MNFDEIRETLVTAFKDSFEASNPSVLIAYENQKFDQPEGIEWVYISVVPGTGRRMEISSSRIFRFEGVVNVSLMAPENDGTKVLYDLAEDIFDIFADQEFSFSNGKITTHRVDLVPRGLVDGWYMINIMADFRADQTVN